MRIEVYKRADGSVWADYALKEPRENSLKTYEAYTRAEMEFFIKWPGDVVRERVRALAERALKEHMARNQQPEPEVFLTPLLVQVKDRNFLGRLHWLVMGK